MTAKKNVILFLIGAGHNL